MNSLTISAKRLAAMCCKRSRITLFEGKPMRAFFLTPLLASILSLLASTVIAGDDKKVDLKVGDTAPAFQSKDAAGLTWKSADHLGKKYIIVYFYPGDFTPGCTAQAKKFQENMNKLYDQGAEVVGVSGDSVKTHALFKDTYKLTYTLVADETGNLAKQFGVPVSKGADVKFRMPDKTLLEFKREVTAARWTFVIGLDGKIVYKNTKVNPVDDSKQISVFLEKMAKK
jgi:peroxiredoxin Q/BCP